MAKAYKIKPVFFRTNQTEKVFPKFSFTLENVPLGNSIPLCLSIHWGEIARGKHYNIMKPVEGFPQCSAVNEKIIWNEGDSTSGIDIPTLIHSIHEVECADEDCEEYCKINFNGAFVNGVNKHICYSYVTIDSICIVIKYDKLRGQYLFGGGCYPGNQTYKMAPATVGHENNFANVKIEIRDYSDPLIQAGEWTDFEYNFGQRWKYISLTLNFILLIAIGICGYVGYDIYKTRKIYKGAPNDLMGGEEDKGMPRGSLGLF